MVDLALRQLGTGRSKLRRTSWLEVEDFDHDGGVCSLHISTTIRDGQLAEGPADVGIGRSNQARVNLSDPHFR